MPYKSDKQRRFMHAQHPKIAEKWDAEIRAQRAKDKKARRKKPARTEPTSTPGYKWKGALKRAQ